MKITTPQQLSDREVATVREICGIFVAIGPIVKICVFSSSTELSPEVLHLSLLLRWTPRSGSEVNL